MPPRKDLGAKYFWQIFDTEGQRLSFPLQLTSAFKRLFAWLANICVARLFMALLWPLESFQALLQTIREDLVAFLPNMGELAFYELAMADVLLLLLVSQLLSALLTLIFSSSPGLWLWGGEFVDNQSGEREEIRLRGAAREVLIFPLLVLLPLQFVCFWGIRTPQEVLTKTAVSFAPLNSTFYLPIFVRGLIFLFLFLLGLAFSPYGVESYLEDENLFLKKAPKREDLPPLIEKKEKEFATHKSQSLKFSTRGPIAASMDNTYLLMPSFELKKKPQKVFLHPQIRVFKKGSTQRGRLYREGKWDWRNVLRYFKKRSPFFAFTYPALNSLLQEKTEGEKLSHEQVDELKGLLGDVFSIRLFGQWKFWSAPYYQLRERFEEFVTPGGQASVSFLPMGSENFLRFRQYFSGQKGHAQLVEVFISMKRVVAPVYHFYWKASGEEQSLSLIIDHSEDFLSKFLTNAKWGEVEKSGKREKFSSLGVLDLAKKTEKDNAEKLLSSYYRNLVEEVQTLTETSGGIKKALVRELRQLEILIRAKTEKQIFPVEKKFSLKIKKLREKLEGDR